MLLISDVVDLPFISGCTKCDGVTRVSDDDVVCSGSHSGSHLSFPADFFESATHSNEVEFGGSDVLQVYNTAQVKQRLNTTGLYIASTKVSSGSTRPASTSPAPR